MFQTHIFKIGLWLKLNEFLLFGSTPEHNSEHLSTQREGECHLPLVMITTRVDKRCEKKAFLYQEGQ